MVKGMVSGYLSEGLSSTFGTGTEPDLSFLYKYKGIGILVSGCNPSFAH